jgi:oligosaccharyltransferase complex subunit beta
VKDIVRNEFKTSEKSGASHSVVGFQGRNNARAVFSGSIDICADEFTKDEKIANLKFCVEVSKWVLNEKGILRHSKITHFKENDPKPKGNLEGEYTINDDLVYSIDLEELKGGNWAQFKTTKAYVEFVMLEPKIRKYLQFSSGSLSAKFRAPDVHGVYQFKTFLHEPGYTWIETASKATVRPYKHNQFERFLMCATPYYSSVFASISGFVIFSFSFLYHKSS